MFNPLPTATVQALLTEARFLDTKPEERHCMATWHFTSSCGTASCALGDMAARGDCGLELSEPVDVYSDPHDELMIDRSVGLKDWPHMDGFTAAVMAFGITLRESHFLFSANPQPHHRVPSYRDNETPQQTAARIRKYLYYRLRKAEILADYEKARRTEGDLNVCQQAVTFSKEHSHV